uniref:RNase H type-1 domain-containing protein n=1 Tax=Cannabis sativa TaxID=3483 RepID=A0A803QRG6_CANSA
MSPQKSTIFCGVLFRVAFATKAQLDTKHVNVDLMCPFCNLAIEYIHHVLLQCGFAQSCWRVSSVNLAILVWMLISEAGFLMWLRLKSEMLEVVRSVRVVLDQWKNAQSRKGGALLVDVINNVSELWRKPMLNTVKVNVDRAIFEAQNKFGFGCVGRDSNGRLFTTFFASRVGLVKPEIVETIGIKKVLSWIKKKQWANVIIETDALLVVQAIKSSILMHAFPV